MEEYQQATCMEEYANTMVVPVLVEEFDLYVPDANMPANET